MCRLIEHYLDERPKDVVAMIWHYGKLEVITDITPKCKVAWRYHVAPVVKVNGAWLVIDPSMFREPVTVEQWRNA